jgi:hypothetical protein
VEIDLGSARVGAGRKFKAVTEEYVTGDVDVNGIVVSVVRCNAGSGLEVEGLDGLMRF